MEKTLYDLKEVIKKLPLKDKYTKDELLTKDLLIEKEGDIEIYYAAHNEYINKDAKLLMVGITPGFIQMNDGISEARRLLEEGCDIEKIQYECKKKARYSGGLRRNIIEMFDELNIHEVFNLKSTSEFFIDKDEYIHSVPLIPYAVFVKGKNYTGHTPKLIKTPFLMNYVYDNFIPELKSINNYNDILIVPLGRAVEEVLEKLCDEGIINERCILKGFPHPSGANVNRKKQFEEHKTEMLDIIKREIKSN